MEHFAPARSGAHVSFAALSLATAVAVLMGLALLPPIWHLSLGIAGWLIIRWGARDVHHALGRPSRWLQALLALCLLGAIFGDPDAQAGSWSWSQAGALSGATMVVRAFALVAVASLASWVLPIRRWAQQLSNPIARRLLQVVIIAANLVPVQLRALSIAASNLKERRPGIRRLPKRLWLLAVHSALQAAMLAESVAFDMAVAAHNADNHKMESP